MPLENVQFIEDGEQVTGGVAGRPDQTLDRNIRQLKNLFDAATLGEALFLRDVSVKSDVLVGQPVAWEPTNQRYEKGLAAVEISTTTGVVTQKPSANVAGIVVSKANSTLATIITLGKTTIDAEDLANAIPGTSPDGADPGLYYLSGQTAGQMVSQAPAVSVLVLEVLGTSSAVTTIHVRPILRNFLTEHVHYKFDLTCRPAGETSPPDYGERHTITDADDSLSGWLPADDASFSGNAPIGTAFGYNLAAHPALQSIWPPIPVEAATVVQDKGVARVGGTELPLGPSGLVVIDRNGIWWMSDCYDDVPWPTNLDTSFSGSSSSSLTELECPRDETMRITISFARATFANSHAVVTSATPDTDSPITIIGCDGLPATTGDLRFGLNLALLVDDEDTTGAQALKNLSSGKFLRGYMTEGLIAGANVTLESDHQRYETPGDASTSVVYQGIVTINAALSPVDRELAPQIVRLSKAKERFDLDVPYIAFPTVLSSSLRLRFNVPPAGLSASPTVKLRAVFTGTTTGTLPTLTASYRRLPRPASATQIAIPTADTAMTFTTALAITADYYREVESTAFAVVEGDTVFVEISRAASDSYAGEVGLIRCGLAFTA